jgi:large subunit ribosomal protein L23
MALLDFLKNKKSVEKAKKGKKVSSFAKASADKEKKAELSAPVSSAKQAIPRVKKASVFSHSAVKQPHISEKATYLAEQSQYIFDVLPDYNKNEIKKSVEGIYNVDVLSVNIIKIPAKKRRMGKTQGWRKGYTKAIVKIKEGQKIEIL